MISIVDAPEMPRPQENHVQPQDNTIRLNDVHFGYDQQEVLHDTHDALIQQDGIFQCFVDQRAQAMNRKF